MPGPISPASNARLTVNELRSNGRRHHYSVNLDAPLLLPTNDHSLTLRPVMKEMMAQAEREQIVTCDENDS